MTTAKDISFLLPGLIKTDGSVLQAGTITFYEAGTVNFKTVWLDANKNTTASNPYTLDSVGVANLYGDGIYDVVVKDSSGNVVRTWDDIQLSPFNILSPYINASSFGDDMNDTTISAAIDSAAGDDRTVYLVPGEWEISDNLTIPSNINLRFEMGAYTTIANTKTLAYTGTLEAPFYNVHRGAGSVTFSSKNPFIASIWKISGTDGDLQNTQNISFLTGKGLQTGTTSGNTLLIQAYDNDTGPGYTTFITLTAGNTPTCDLSDSVTKSGQYIYRASGTDVALADGGTGASLADPNADRILFWDDSGGATTWLAMGNSIAITTTTLDTIQDIRTTATPSFAGMTLTSPLSVANGGTGAATATAGFDALSPLTTLGDVLYHNGTNNVRLAGNTTTTAKALLQTGDGANSAAPSWTAIPTSISGTTNQISASASTGAITLSTPQNIHTSATPTFSRLTLSQSTGTAPLTISSTTVCTNLNSDLLDGQHGSYYNDAGNLTGTVASARISGSYTGITLVGTLTALTVDNIGFDGNTITVQNASGNLNILASSGSSGRVNIDNDLLGLEGASFACGLVDNGDGTYRLCKAT